MCVLELQISFFSTITLAAQRDVINSSPDTHTHTHRFSHPERELMRQVINLNQLAGGGAATSAALSLGPAMRSLAVAASHPDVITGVGSSDGMAGGAGARDEVCVARVFVSVCKHWLAC